MTPRQKQLVQETFAKVVPISDQAAALFYGRLFEADPALRGLFKTDMQVQGRKLMQMIGYCVGKLDALPELIPAVKELGRKHAGYRVKSTDYATVGAALLWTLEQGLGPAFHAGSERGLDRRLPDAGQHHDRGLARRARLSCGYAPAPMNKGRMEAFSDGVLAIIITIMVLELKVPEGDTLAALAPMKSVFLAYVLSFAYVGIYWNNHHHLLQTVKHVTGGLLWANLHLLFWLSLFPS